MKSGQKSFRASISHLPLPPPPQTQAPSLWPREGQRGPPSSVQEEKGHWPGVRSSRSLLFPECSLLPKGTTPVSGQCARNPGSQPPRCQTPTPATNMLGPLLSLHICPLPEPSKRSDPPLRGWVGRYLGNHRRSYTARAYPAALRACLCQQRPPSQARKMTTLLLVQSRPGPPPPAQPEDISVSSSQLLHSGARALPHLEGKPGPCCRHPLTRVEVLETVETQPSQAPRATSHLFSASQYLSRAPSKNKPPNVSCLPAPQARDGALKPGPL